MCISFERNFEGFFFLENENKEKFNSGRADFFTTALFDPPGNPDDNVK